MKYLVVKLDRLDEAVTNYLGMNESDILLDDIKDKGVVVDEETVRLGLLTPIAWFVTKWNSRKLGADRSDLLRGLAKAIISMMEGKK